MLEYNSIPKHAFESQPKRIRTYSADNSEYLSTHPFSSIVSIDVDKIFVHDPAVDNNGTKSISSQNENPTLKRNPLLELLPLSYDSKGTVPMCNELKEFDNTNSKFDPTKEDEKKEESGAYFRHNYMSTGMRKLKWPSSNSISNLLDISKENKCEGYETSNGDAKGEKIETITIKRDNSFTGKFGNASTKDLRIKINPVKISNERCLNFKYAMERNYLSRKQIEKEQSMERSKPAKGPSVLKCYKSTDDAIPKGPSPEICVPKNAEEVRHYKYNKRICKSSITKMDTLNGWSWHGDPIQKTHENKNVKQTRCYYIAIKRNNTVIYTHDIVLIHPPKEGLERPYVARIASLWCDQLYESGTKQSRRGIEKVDQASMMMTVYWYYRPENIEPYTFTPSDMEVFESKHYDDNSVACIIDRAFVLSYHGYCRFCAMKKFYREAAESYQDLTLRRIVPALPTKDLSFPPEDTDISLVFFCRSAYNCNTGKISVHH